MLEICLKMFGKKIIIIFYYKNWLTEMSLNFID